MRIFLNHFISLGSRDIVQNKSLAWLTRGPGHSIPTVKQANNKLLHFKGSFCGLWLPSQHLEQRQRIWCLCQGWATLDPGLHPMPCLKDHTKHQQKVHVPNVFLRKTSTLYVLFCIFDSSFTLVLIKISHFQNPLQFPTLETIFLLYLLGKPWLGIKLLCILCSTWNKLL